MKVSKDLLVLAHAVAQHASGVVGDTSVWVTSEGLHISLSRPFALRLHQIDPFIRALNDVMQGLTSYVVDDAAEATLQCCCREFAWIDQPRCAVHRCTAGEQIRASAASAIHVSAQ